MHQFNVKYIYIFNNWTYFIVDKLNWQNQAKAMSLKSGGENMFFATLMGRELTIVNNQGNRTLLFITKDADFMRLIKKHFHGKTEICSQNVKVCADSLKKYNVSFSFHVIYVDISCHKFISIFFLLS